jgi:hypothetical protein
MYGRGTERGANAQLQLQPALPWLKDGPAARTPFRERPCTTAASGSGIEPLGSRVAFAYLGVTIRMSQEFQEFQARDRLTSSRQVPPNVAQTFFLCW